MNGKIDNNRLIWIDWAKTLGIFFICIGHFLSSGDILRIFLYTFHVPLFFVVAGINFKPISDFSHFKSYTKKLLFRIIVPYTIWFVLSEVIFVILKKVTLYEFITKLLFLDGTTIWNSALWFLPCFFIVSVFIAFVSLYAKKYTIYIGFGLTLLSLIIDLLGYKEFFLGLNKCMFLTGFYLLGWKSKVLKSTKGNLLYIIPFLLVGATYAYINRGEVISILNCQYNNNMLLWLIVSYIMVISFIELCKLLPRLKYLELISNNTMFIMCSHIWFRMMIDIFIPSLQSAVRALIGVFVFFVYVVILIFMQKSSMVRKYTHVVGKYIGIKI